MKPVDKILIRLTDLISRGEFENLETEVLEIKPVPVDGGSWREREKTVNAFLNTRGGILILGIGEKQISDGKKLYELRGYQESAEPKIKALAERFTDRRGSQINVQEWLPYFEIKDLLDSKVGILYIDPLPLELKYCFLDDEAFVRRVTGDHRLKDPEIARHEELKEELTVSRELERINSTTLQDIDLDRLNEYIALLNKQIRVESLKPSLEQAQPFLERKSFILQNVVTTLGMLVCGKHPEDKLNFRCQVHGFVEPDHTLIAGQRKLAQDRKIIVGNVLPLLEGALNFIYQNIQVGIRTERGGQSAPEYPDELLRETVNNALAHRDYSIDRYVSITIEPGTHIEIRNPGSFRKQQIIEHIDGGPAIRRIIPDPKAQNPKLAQVLMVYNKWEGRGIGMATLTNLCLADRIDLPYYRFYTESDVGLFLRRGHLLDDNIEQLLKSFDEYIEKKSGGEELTPEQKLVLAYVIKSEWANEKHFYTIALTRDNDHFDALRKLESWGLLHTHPASPPLHPVYLADRNLVVTTYRHELEPVFGEAYRSLDDFQRRILDVVYRHNKFSKLKVPSARTVAFNFYFAEGKQRGDVREFDRIYRKVKLAFNRLEKAQFISKKSGNVGYSINTTFLQDNLL